MALSRLTPKNYLEYQNMSEKVWISFFSQTGTEIANVSNKIGRWPDVIVTNKTSIEGVNDELLEHIDRLIMIPNKPSLDEYGQVTAFATTLGDNVFLNNENKFEGMLITLHGYLRIIPKEVCSLFYVYNGHPGDIVNYPELKGKDPQDRVTEDMTTIGSVIHKVTLGVDEGEIVAHQTRDWTALPKSVRKMFVTGTLREISEELWVEFLKKQFNII